MYSYTSCVVWTWRRTDFSRLVRLGWWRDGFFRFGLFIDLAFCTYYTYPYVPVPERRYSCTIIRITRDTPLRHFWFFYLTVFLFFDILAEFCGDIISLLRDAQLDHAWLQFGEHAGLRVATIRQLYYLWLRVARGKPTSHKLKTPGLEKQYLIIQTPAVFLEEKKRKSRF